MTKGELTEYRSIVAELAEVRVRLSGQTVHGVVRGSEHEFPYVQRSFSVGGVVETGESRADMALLCRLEMQKKAIEDFVNAIPDSVTRRIFRYRYIDGKVKPSWQWIAVRIGGGNTEDAVKQRASRYLKNL